MKTLEDAKFAMLLVKLPAGEERTYLECRYCKNIMVREYIPYGLGQGRTYDPCLCYLTGNNSLNHKVLFTEEGVDQMSMMNLTPEEEEHIQAMRREKEKLKPSFCFEEYSHKEKVAKFDQLFKMAADHYNEVKQKGYIDCDVKQWIFEAVMELLGKDVWKTYNTFYGNT